ncbi:MAG: flagellar basal body P-ring formation chaperone FlgA [Hydrogenophilus sp.]|nr:flagellar basal body P-ring formation chaperone FlgA [Hydrogenophilus sp.]
MFLSHGRKKGRRGWQLLPYPVTLAAFSLAVAAFPLFASQRLDAAAIAALVRDALTQETAGWQEEVHIEVPPPTEADHLPPCNAVAPELPSEWQRLRGRIVVTVRCLHPSSWTLHIPATVRRFGTYYVAARPLRHGARITAEDLLAQRGERTQMAEDLIDDPSEAIDKVLRVSIAAGQPIRRSWLSSPIVIRQGQEVRIIQEGPGFRVEGRAQALNRAAVGDPVRVRLANGQTVTGTAIADGIVRLAP